MRGRIKFWLTSRGFGFLTPDGGGADVFVHISALTDRALINGPPQDAVVEYEVSADPRSGRPCAASVRVISLPAERVAS